MNARLLDPSVLGYGKAGHEGLGVGTRILNYISTTINGIVNTSTPIFCLLNRVHMENGAVEGGEDVADDLVKKPDNPEVYGNVSS